MKRIIPLIGVILVFLTFQAVSIIARVDRLSFPGAKHTNSCETFGSSTVNGLSCSCTDKATYRQGYPFRTNLYDSCTQDESNHWRIQLVNLAIQLAISAGVYVIFQSVDIMGSRS